MYLLLITVGMFCGACQAAAFTIVGVGLRMDEGNTTAAELFLEILSHRLLLSGKK